MDTVTKTNLSLLFQRFIDEEKQFYNFETESPLKWRSSNYPCACGIWKGAKKISKTTLSKISLVSLSRVSLHRLKEEGC